MKNERKKEKYKERTKERKKASRNYANRNHLEISVLQISQNIFTKSTIYGSL